VRVWRIVRERHVAEPFSGEGSRRFPGRWNSRGLPLAYSSERLSLAAIELFVHVVEEDEPGDLMAIEAEIAIDAKTVARQQSDVLKRLKTDWRFDVGATRAMGDEWFAARESLVMLVPSVVIEVEWNVLINPQHADFAGLKVVQTRPFRFDERMFKAKH